MNINSNETSAIVDSLFRFVQDGLALHGPVGAWHRVLRERLENRLLFMLLDRSRGALGCCLLID